MYCIFKQKHSIQSKTEKQQQTTKKPTTHFITFTRQLTARSIFTLINLLRIWADAFYSLTETVLSFCLPDVQIKIQKRCHVKFRGSKKLKNQLSETDTQKYPFLSE